MGLGKKVIKMGTLSVCEGIDWYVGIRSLINKSSSDPLQGAALDMVSGHQSPGCSCASYGGGRPVEGGFVVPG